LAMDALARGQQMVAAPQWNRRGVTSAREVGV
jgi:hypothetical protein